MNQSLWIGKLENVNFLNPMEMLLYIGPGLGIGTIILVLLVLLVVLVSLLIIVWTPIKKFFRNIKQMLGK